jgi:hypothetical protein
MKTRPLSLGDPAQPEDFGWVDSILKERGSTRHPREEDESHLVRTVFVLLLLGSLACLLAYSIRSVAAGDGRHLFLFMATLAALLACGAAVLRTWIWLRFLLVLASLCVCALLVDQFTYYRWHKGVERVMTGLQQGMKSGSLALTAPMEPGPTSFSIDADRGVLLKFEPPILAWMYHLDSASPLGHTLAAGWYRILSKVTRGRSLDGVAQTIVRPHEVYAVGIMSDEGPPVCRADEAGQWTLSIDTQRGRRSL